MIHLLNNKCVASIVLDQDAGQNTGDIFFYNGEVYCGEISQNQPLGQGILKLSDNSEFQGFFESQSMKEGTFHHFTGLKMKGIFSRDRLHKGTIKFIDGDKLEGEWGLKKGKWILKKGKIFDENSELIQELQLSQNSFKNKKKEIYFNDEELGFYIKFHQYYDINNNCYSPIILTGEGTTIYEQKISNNQILKKKIQYMTIPYQQEEIFDKDQQLSNKINMCLGENLFFEKNNSENKWKLTFESYKEIYANGQLDFEKQKLRFLGKLNFGEQIVPLEIKRGLIGKLQIKLDNECFNSFQEFEKYIKKNYPETKIQKLARGKRKSEVNKPVMRELIQDIKKHECTIF